MKDDEYELSACGADNVPRCGYGGHRGLNTVPQT